jgi:hypothetical protein
VVGLVHEGAVGLLDEQAVSFEGGAAVGADAAEHVHPAVLVEVGGLAVVPVKDGTEEARIRRAERAVFVVEVQVAGVPVVGDEQVRPAIAGEVGDRRAEGSVRGAADARGGGLVGDRHRDRGRRRRGRR